MKLSKLIFNTALSTLALSSVYAEERRFTNEPVGICVFDIDYTLKCDGAYAAVDLCKQAGFALAINTAREKDKAYEAITDGTLIEKGFDQEFIDNALVQKGLDGPFQYAMPFNSKQPREQQIQGKSFGMRNIAKHYNMKLDDISSRRIILFDDLPTNTVQMQPSLFESYSTERCKADQNGICYDNPNANIPRRANVSFPRNWKIYRSKWIGFFCQTWNDPYTAAVDASEMIYSALSDAPRDRDWIEW